MYRIVAKKQGRPHYKNVKCFLLLKYPSRFVVNLVAKKTLLSTPKFFVLNEQNNTVANVFYKLTHRIEFDKSRVELYLAVTGALFASMRFDLVKQQQTLSKINKSLCIEFV